MWFRNILGVALLAAVMPASASSAGDSGPKVGLPSPNLIGRTMDDRSYRLKGDKGSPKVINFFSVTCKPCREEMPELAKLEKQYTGVKFISVHTQEEKPEVVDRFVKALPGAPSNIVLTSGGVQEAFRYLGLPHTIVLDSDNVVLMNLTGYTPENMRALEQALQQLAKK